MHAYTAIATHSLVRSDQYYVKTPRRILVDGDEYYLLHYPIRNLSTTSVFTGIHGPSGMKSKPQLGYI